jgi:hypothetical protein
MVAKMKDIYRIASVTADMRGFGTHAFRRGRASDLSRVPVETWRTGQEMVSLIYSVTTREVGGTDLRLNMQMRRQKRQVGHESQLYRRYPRITTVPHEFDVALTLGDGQDDVWSHARSL